MEFILLIFLIFPYSVHGQDTRGASQTSYENKLSYIDETLLDLKERLATLENENAVLRESVEIADGKREGLRDQIRALEVLPDAVGFTAKTSNFHPYEYNGSATVRFSNIVANLGGHYNASSSKFKCPRNGTYMFSVVYVTVNNRETYVDIVLDGSGLVQGLADDVGDAYNTASAHVITACSAGQQVWIRASGYGRILTSGPWNQFCGALVWPGI